MNNIEEMNIKITFSSAEQHGDRKDQEFSYAAPSPPPDGGFEQIYSHEEIEGPPPDDFDANFEPVLGSDEDPPIPPDMLHSESEPDADIFAMNGPIPPELSYENDFSPTLDEDIDIGPPEDNDVKPASKKTKGGSSKAKK